MTNITYYKQKPESSEVTATLKQIDQLNSSELWKYSGKDLETIDKTFNIDLNTNKFATKLFKAVHAIRLFFRGKEDIKNDMALSYLCDVTREGSTKNDRENPYFKGLRDRNLKKMDKDPTLRGIFYYFPTR